MSDGFLDLIIIRDCPKLSLLSLMTELNNGKHVKSPFVTYIKVHASFCVGAFYLLSIISCETVICDRNL